MAQVAALSALGFMTQIATFRLAHAARLPALSEGSRATFAGKAGARFCIERMQL